MILEAFLLSGSAGLINLHSVQTSLSLTPNLSDPLLYRLNHLLHVPIPISFENL